MPKWGMEMDEGTVQEWLVAEGDAVAAGQAIVLVETDKIVNEVEVDHAGVVRRLVAEAGENYPVGALLAVIADAEVDLNLYTSLVGRKFTLPVIRKLCCLHVSNKLPLEVTI